MPDLTEQQAERLARLYAAAESDLMNEISRALIKGNQTQYLKGMLSNVQAIITNLQKGVLTWCGEAVPALYIDGANYAGNALTNAGYDVVAGFGAIHQEAMQVLADNTYQSLAQITQTIGRQTQDIYRQLALENIRGSVAGNSSWQTVAKNFRERLAERGVTGFVDRAGKRWNMRTYAGMVARTSTMEAHLSGTANRLLEHGHDLVMVSRHANACDKCKPWEGRKLSLTGRTPGYPTLADAKAAGLWHPNCGHTQYIAMSWEDAQ